MTPSEAEGTAQRHDTILVNHDSTRVLLVDLTEPGAEDLCGQLRQVLVQFCPCVSVLAESPGAREPAWSAALERYEAQTVFLCLPRNALQALPWLDRAIGHLRDTPVFAVTAEADPTRLASLLEHGIDDFAVPPFNAADIAARLWRALKHRDPARSLTRKITERVGLSRLVGGSPAFVRQTAKIPLLARCDASVLISGETGTGKEVVARAIHYLSPRMAGPFVPVNCGAIPAELLESELFGHERAAFTGAHHRRTGLVESADGGTLLLDEVDCLPKMLQVKLLRFLQDREYRRLGSNSVRVSDCRILAGTNADLERELERGTLRRDLYYRLDVLRLNLPPLRDRDGDLLLLARHFLGRLKSGRQRPGLRFSEAAVEALYLHDWPGNVRELEHAVERAVVLSGRHSTIEPHHLDLPSSTGSRRFTFDEERRRVVSRFESAYIARLLAAYRGNVTRAARAANRSRRGLTDLIRRHDIDVNRFRSVKDSNE